MKITFEMNPQQAFSRMFSDRTLFYANSRLHAYCDKYVPMDTGILAQNVTITKDALTYNAPYAKKIYLGKGLSFSKDLHPLATNLWDKAMAVSDGQRLAEDIQEFIKRGGV